METDYLIVGAGAMSMAFADVIFSERPDAQMVIVDRRHRPGGHWTDAYPYVALHQPKGCMTTRDDPHASQTVMDLIVPPLEARLGRNNPSVAQQLAPDGVDPNVMSRLTEAAFGQRRKMLRSSLKSFEGAVEAAESIGIDLQRRAETLSVEEYVKLARTLS